MSDKLALTQATLNSVARTKDVIDLPAVRDNWVRTYEKVTGKSDGVMRFEAEKVLFMQTVGDNTALDKCDRFSLYSAWTELAISGLTLRDGLTYIIPYGKKASFMVGWKGRLEQIMEIPTVTFVNQPKVVYDCDDFDYEEGVRTKINKHKRGNRTEQSIITHVYMGIDFAHGQEVYIMDRLEVLAIRDNFSESYKQYLVDLPKVKENGKITRFKRGGETWEADFKPPMWVTSEDQAWKKTLVKRVWGTLPKLPKHKYLDEQMIIASKAVASGPDAATYADAEELTYAAENETDEPKNTSNEQEQDFSSFSNVEAEKPASEIKPNENFDKPEKEAKVKKEKVTKPKPEASPSKPAASEEPKGTDLIEEAVIVEDETEQTQGAVVLDESDLEGDSF